MEYKAILGINLGHDSGATLIINEEINFAINEERLNRKKYYSGFPILSINESLKHANINFKDLSIISIEGKYIKPSINTSFDLANSDWKKNMITFLRLDSLILGTALGINLTRIILKIDTLIFKIRILNFFYKRGFRGSYQFHDHHHCHAASAFFSQTKAQGLAVTLDANGEGYCSKVFICDNQQMQLVHSIACYHSPAYYYAYITKILGFTPLRHEGKVTGLAAFGNKNYDLQKIFNNYISYDSKKISFLNKGGYHYRAIKNLSNDLMGFTKEDIAFNIQHHIENITIQYISDLIGKHYPNNKSINLFLSGGLFSNVKLNQRINDEINNLNSLYIFPNMGDGGLNCGAAILASNKNKFNLNNMYLGPHYSNYTLQNIDCSKFVTFAPPQLPITIAKILAKGYLVGICRDRMEYGPRALGNRSIIFSSNLTNINDIVNSKLQRSEFMPFAPIIRHDDFYNFMEPVQNETKYDYMTITCKVNQTCKSLSPAITHIDNTARPQVIDKEDNNFLYEILTFFYSITKNPTIVNTSFNMHEEPIVNTPNEAYNAFMKADLDALVLDDCIIIKKEIMNQIS
jgi:carbamoyltransferase